MDMETIKRVYLSRDGRIGLKTFWIFIIPLMLAVAPAYFSDFNKTTDLIYALVALVAFYPTMVINIKRAHDRNRSGWFVLLFFVPILHLWPVIELNFIPGSEGSNKFGEPDNTWK